MANEKILRKYLGHFIDVTFGSASPKYVRLGKDLEELNIEMNPDVETKKNILGENSVIVNGYDPQVDVDTYYCYRDDAMYEHLLEMINSRATGSDCETTVVDIVIAEDGSVESAYREKVVVTPNSLGGDNSGVQIPFTYYYAGERTKGTFDISTKEFTPA